METNPTHKKENATDFILQEISQVVNPKDITVSANNGVALLSGTVENYPRKLLAEQVVSSLTGIKSISNEIQVISKSEEIKKAQELADQILNAFIKNFNEPEETFSMKVENDWLTLVGEVESSSGQKVAVKGYVCELIEAEPKSKSTKQPALLTAEQLDYWEIFG